MGQYTTKTLTEEMYGEIISNLKNGYGVKPNYHRPNERAATVLQLEGNLGMRISDIVRLKPKDIIQDGARYRLDVIEQKTGKKRTFTVPNTIYLFIQNYVLKNHIAEDERIFNITPRSVQRSLEQVCLYLGYDKISTHSFRKWYATEIYKNNNYDIVLVQRLLQHASAATTQKYIGIEPQKIEDAIAGHMHLI